MPTTYELSNILSIDDLERAATERMDAMTRGYFNGAAGDGVTLRDNISSYYNYKLRPRVLRDVSKIDPSTEFLGRKIAFPVCVAPTAMQRLAHPDGEVATSRAAAKMGVAIGLSSFSTTPLEEVLEAARGKVDLVLQLYVMQNRKASEVLVKRAEKAGYKAIFLTVDTPYLGRRHAETRNKFKLPPHLSLGNFTSAAGENVAVPDNRMSTAAALKKNGEAVGGGKAVGETGTGATRIDVKSDKGLPGFGVVGQEGAVNANDPSLCWTDISWLRSITSLPIYLKGILTPEDAGLAISHSCAGIILSNHGGRQLDHALSTIDALPACAAVAKGRIPIHIDGGIRRGSDVFKALALGADCVWVGRPAVWGLVVGGEEGVKRMLEVLYEEFVSCMALVGCRNVGEIGREYVVWKGRDGRLEKL